MIPKLIPDCAIIFVSNCIELIAIKEMRELLAEEFEKMRNLFIEERQAAEARFEEARAADARAADARAADARAADARAADARAADARAAEARVRPPGLIYFTFL